MYFMNRIIGYLNDASWLFYEIYLEVYGWIWPFSYLQYPFWDLSSIFSWLAWGFRDFTIWVYEVNNLVTNILSWSTIESYIRNWLPHLVDVVHWWHNWVYFLSREINNWWYYTQATVQGWIDIATQGFDNLVVAWDEFWTYTWPRWTDKLDLLAADWGDFLIHKLPTLFDISYAEEWWRSKFLDVTKAISDAFREREDFWAGWQDFRDKVVEFFTDPLEWLLDRFTDWFLGPEE